MKLQSQIKKFKNKFGMEVSKKILYLTRYGIMTGKAHQGIKECQRRIRQSRAGMCYIHRGQYSK